MSRGPEGTLQDKIKAFYEKEGWLVLKNIKVSKNGWPDISLYKEGQTVFLEVKAPKGGRRSKLQQYYIDKLRALGFRACFVRSVEDCESCIRNQKTPDQIMDKIQYK